MWISGEFLKEARDERGREIFETFSSDGLSFLVAEWSRWQKKKECTTETKFVGLCKTRKSWVEFDRKKRVMEAVEDYLKNCAHAKVDIDVVLKYSTRRGSFIFQLLDTSEKPNHFVASRRRWLESQGKMVHGKKGGHNEWHAIEYRGAKWQRRRAPRGP